MSGPLVVVDAAELAVLLRDAVTAALAELDPHAQPVALDRAGIAAALGTTTRTVDRLRSEGLPEFRLVDAPRFVLADCLAWLKSRGPAGKLILDPPDRREVCAACGEAYAPHTKRVVRELGGQERSWHMACAPAKDAP